MSAFLPPALLTIAGALALVLVWPRLRAQPSDRRLFAEAFSMGLLALALVWVAWALLWMIEQRW